MSHTAPSLYDVSWLTRLTVAIKHTVGVALCRELADWAHGTHNTHGEGFSLS
jgi:hypothetical protein